MLRNIGRAWLVGEIKVSVGAPWLLRGEHDFHAESSKSNVEPVCLEVMNAFLIFRGHYTN